MNILICEDNESLLECLSCLFKEEGLSFYSASNGEEGIYILKAAGIKFDVLILDMMMKKLLRSV